MRLRGALLLVLCSGCNALTGASDLEPVGCTADCVDARAPVDSSGDSSRPDTTGAEVATDTAPAEDAAVHCSNGTKDPLESDVDCGGPGCAKCTFGRTCNANSDCASGQCTANKCARCAADMAQVTVGTAQYCIDTHEVTNAEYKAWLDTAPNTLGQPAACDFNKSFVPTTGWPPIALRLNHPVRYVDWCDARAYCAGQNKRLCGAIGGGAAPFAGYADATVDEWHHACSMGGARMYPYGTTYDPDYCNAAGNTFGTTVPVGSLTTCTNLFGPFDMSGNVSEWEDNCRDPSGSVDGCRARGGSYATMDPRCNLSEVYSRQTTSEWIGIRCCDD